MKPQAFEKAMKTAAGMLKDPEPLLQTVGFIAEAEVKQGAPVDTGTYRRSINSRVDGNAAYVGSALVYAPPLEFGTRYMAAQEPIGGGIRRAIPRIQVELDKYGGQVLETVAKG